MCTCAGALSLKDRTAKDIMTRIEEVFSVDIEGTLDSELLLQLLGSGVHCRQLLLSSSWLRADLS